MKKIKLEKLKNLTPHTIVLVCGNGKNIEIKSDGVIRVAETTEKIGEIEGIAVIKKHLSEIPQQSIEMIRNVLSDEEAAIIVSMLTAKKLKEMSVLSEEELSRVFIIGQTIRDENGRVIGASALAKATDL